MATHKSKTGSCPATRERLSNFCVDALTWHWALNTSASPSFMQCRRPTERRPGGDIEIARLSSALSLPDNQTNSRETLPHVWNVMWQKSELTQFNRKQPKIQKGPKIDGRKETKWGLRGEEEVETKSKGKYTTTDSLSLILPVCRASRWVCALVSRERERLPASVCTPDFWFLAARGKEAGPRRRWVRLHHTTPRGNLFFYFFIFVCVNLPFGGVGSCEEKEEEEETRRKRRSARSGFGAAQV